MPHTIELPKNLTINDLIDKVKQYTRPAELDMVWLAYEVANKAHEGQKRKSGDPYIVHPLATAYILASMRIGQHAHGQSHSRLHVVSIEPMRCRGSSSIL